MNIERLKELGLQYYGEYVKTKGTPRDTPLGLSIRAEVIAMNIILPYWEHIKQQVAYSRVIRIAVTGGRVDTITDENEILKRVSIITETNQWYSIIDNPNKLLIDKITIAQQVIKNSIDTIQQNKNVIDKINKVIRKTPKVILPAKDPHEGSTKKTKKNSGARNRIHETLSRK